MYVEGNPKTKKELKERVASGVQVRVFAPGMGSPLTEMKMYGKVFLEGPHYPQPHRWYGSCKVDDDCVIVQGSVR